jgi:drug/metabolite transporter (DMT)-like permease
VGLAAGEAGRVHLSHVGLTPALGWGYLVVFGSLVAFTSYLWLLRVAPTSLVGTYAYVNPIIAVLAGWLLLHEAITGRTVVGGAVIVVGVALIVTARKVPPAGEPASADPPPRLAMAKEADEGAA